MGRDGEFISLNLKPTYSMKPSAHVQFHPCNTNGNNFLAFFGHSAILFLLNFERSIMQTIYMKELPLKEMIQNLKREMRNIDKRINRLRQAPYTNRKVLEAKRAYEIAYQEVFEDSDKKVDALLQQQSILDKEVDRLTDEMKNQEARKKYGVPNIS